MNALLMALGLAMSLTTAHAAPLVNVETLNAKLKQTNATWTAKDNALNNLSKSEVKRFLGLRGTPAGSVQFVAPASGQKSNLPPSIDWRNKDGRNWVSPILDQGNCGSCVAFATIATLETQYNISSAFPELNLRLSPQNLFECGGGSCDSGWTPDGAVYQLMSQGVPDEACMPYISGATGQDVSCQASCGDTAQRSYKISTYTTPTRWMSNIENVKAALLNGPLITTLTVYADLMTYSSGVYTHTTGDELGGHAVSIVGYDDTTQSLIIRNSWGTSWGEGGFAHISYNDISGVGDQTWGLTLPALSGAVSLITPRDYTYTTGAADLHAISTYPSTDSVVLTVYNSSNQAIWSTNCNNPDCSGSFDSSQVADGRYEVQALAQNNKGAQIDASTRQFFYVVNQAPQLGLNFTGLGVNLAKNLKGRVVFDITTTTSSVPMNLLEFHFKDANGVETVHTTESVLDRMSMGWRTDMGANGTYEIWMVGYVKSSGIATGVQSQHYSVKVKN